MNIEGSRNYIDERVSDIIWSAYPGTKIQVEILDTDKVRIEFLEYGKDPQIEYQKEMDARRTYEEKKASEERYREKLAIINNRMPLGSH